MIDLRLGDCLDVMRGIPDASIDAVITDPPYGTTELAFDKHPIDWESWWLEVKRCLKSNGVAVVFSAQPFTTDLVQSNRSQFRYDLVWCKTMGTRFYDCNKMPLRAHENILVFAPSFHGKGNPKTSTYNPQFTDGKPYRRMRQNDKRPRAIHYNSCADIHQPTINEGKRYPLDWFVFSNGNNGNVHPSQKPLDLMEWLVRTYSDENGVILDTFAGSGTTMIACVNTKRNGTGIEKDAGYYAIAQRRIQEAQAQMSMPMVMA